MATKKISELTNASALTGTEIIPVVQNGSTKQATISDLTSLIGAAEGSGYSTNETLTEKRWIDGKPIYRKVIIFASLVNNTSTDTGITVSDVDNFISFSDTMYKSATTTDAGQYNQWWWNGTTNTIWYYHSSGATGGQTDLIVEYTKTTDTASSPVAQIATGGRTIVNVDTTYYVATTGNDTTGDGSSGNPWATIQHAIDYVANNIDLADASITIQLANGTYPEYLILNTITGNGSLIIQGDTTTPSNCNIRMATALRGNSGNFYIRGIKISGADYAVRSFSTMASITLEDVELGSVNSAQIIIYEGGKVYIAATTLTLSGTSNYFASVGYGSILYCVSVNVVFSSAIYNSSFLNVNNVSSVRWTGITYTGSFTGKEYSIAGCSVIETGNLTTSIPGTIAGTTTENGIIT